MPTILLVFSPMQERVGYPYLPNEGGIPGMDAMAQEGGEFSVRGGSGRELSCVFYDRSIVIEDTKRQKLHLIARVDGSDNLQLDVKSREHHEGPRHPDLNAKRFVEFALQYFQQRGVKIDGFSALWIKGGTNYKEFRDALKENNDKTQAAAQTWSARTMSQHGFTSVEQVLVTPYGVRARFRRPALDSSTSSQ